MSTVSRLVWDRNSVSVTVSAESISIGIRAECFFETENFFFKFYSFFSNSWRNTSFYKLENKPSPSKIIQSISCFEENLILGTLLWWEKIPHAIGN